MDNYNRTMRENQERNEQLQLQMEQSRRNYENNQRIYDIRINRNNSNSVWSR